MAFIGSPQAYATLSRDNNAELFVTLFYAVLDTRTGEFQYSNGGHNPPYVLRAGRAPQALEVTGDTILGMIENLTFKTCTAYTYFSRCCHYEARDEEDRHHPSLERPEQCVVFF